MTIKINIPLKSEVILNILITASDSNSCGYFLKKRPVFLSSKFYQEMKETPEKMKSFSWELVVDDGDKGETHKITFSKIRKGLQKMLEDEMTGKYINRHVRVQDVILAKDFGDSIFAQEVIQYALYGRIIFG